VSDDRPIITEYGKPAAVLQAPANSRFDVQDGLLLGGCLLLVAGIAAIYWPAGLIAAGLLCLGFAHLIERAKRVDGTR
jgi:hypothetical protein